ncbi:MAG: PASTA domain-containing protein, partial [Rhodococcus sp.]|nr:PASTA domain-containing protein [Rhodococcus sp. (in: high G+C Gram-positive bacteria)]
ASGILMFELLTGHTPFQGDTSLSVAYQRVNQDVPRPGSFIDGVPTQFDELVAEATHREPTHRFADAAAMGSALRSVAAALDLPSYRVPAPRRPVTPVGSASTAGDSTTAVVGGTRALTDNRPLPSAGPHPTRMVTTLHSRPDECPGDSAAPAGPNYRGGDAGQRQPDADHSAPRYGFSDHEADRRNSRRNAALWMLLVLALALAVGIGGWWLGSGRFTNVPAVHGLDSTGALSAISAAGLTGEVRGTYSDTEPLDALLGTDPTAGSRIQRDGTVAVLVSLGRPSVPTLPAGGDRNAVEQALRDRTLDPAPGGEVFSARVPAGGVAALDPAPGTTVAVGSRVELIFSKGAPPVEIPNVAGMDEDDARAALDDVGIAVTQVHIEFDPDVEAGYASGTTPEVGTTVDAGTAVTLIVSDAVRVPSLVGRSVGAARDELTNLGLEVQVHQVADTNRSFVVRQNPGSGDLVRPGSTVTLVSFP